MKKSRNGTRAIAGARGDDSRTRASACNRTTRGDRAAPSTPATRPAVDADEDSDNDKNLPIARKFDSSNDVPFLRAFLTAKVELEDPHSLVSLPAICISLGPEWSVPKAAEKIAWFAKIDLSHPDLVSLTYLRGMVHDLVAMTPKKLMEIRASLDQVLASNWRTIRDSRTTIESQELAQSVASNQLARAVNQHFGLEAFFTGRMCLRRWRTLSTKPSETNATTTIPTTVERQVHRTRADEP